MVIWANFPPPGIHVFVIVQLAQTDKMFLQVPLVCDQ